MRVPRITVRRSGGIALAYPDTRARIPESWIRTWERRPPEPPPRTGLLRFAPAWALGQPEVAAPAPPWWRPRRPEPRVEDWLDERAEPRVRVPVFRALLVPIFFGLFFSALSLVVGADLPARLRAALPHRTHVVQPGESLSQIAARYGVGWQELHAAGGNPERHPDPDRVPVGAVLDLPYSAGFAGPVVSALPDVSFSLDLDASRMRACAVLRDLPGIGPLESGGVLRLCTDP